MQQKRLYILISIISAGLIFVALGGGVFHQAEPYYLQWQHRLFGHLCHQDPARSLWFNGQPMAVCSRCFGIYVLFGGGWLLLPLVPSVDKFTLHGKKMVIAAVIAANLVDIIGNFFGFWQNTPLSRLALGGLLGLSVVMLFTNEFLSFKTKQTGDADGTVRTTSTG